MLLLSWTNRQGGHSWLHCHPRSVNRRVAALKRWGNTAIHVSEAVRPKVRLMWTTDVRV